MGDDLRQDGLGLVVKSIVRSVVPMSGEFHGLSELPFQIDREANRYLIASEAGRKI